MKSPVAVTSGTTDDTGGAGDLNANAAFSSLGLGPGHSGISSSPSSSLLYEMEMKMKEKERDLVFDDIDGQYNGGGEMSPPRLPMAPMDRPSTPGKCTSMSMPARSESKTGEEMLAIRLLGY